MTSTRIRAVAVAALAVAAVALPGAAHAAPPANDAFAGPTLVTSLPYSDAVDVSEAGVEPGEPGGGCYSPGKTVWYAFEPASDLVLDARAAAANGSFSTVLNVYRATGPGLGDLAFVACAYPWSSAVVELAAGQTYYIQAGAASWDLGGVLTLNLQRLAPPPNDDFVNARPIGALPYSDWVDAGGATVEMGEPSPSCGYGQSAGTIWYAFTASHTDSYSFWASGSISTQVAAYTGTALGSLSQIGCRAFGGSLTFRAEEGQTYYLQLGGLFGGRGSLGLTVDVAPDPVAWFWYSPTEPTIYDTVSFSGSWFDPVGNPIVEQVFEFGDGSTADGCCPQHRYAADGDYTARLRVRTSDGRVGTYEQVIRVRTHDVSVTRFAVPQTARVGQTRELTVGIRNTQYAENVTVQVFRSRIGGGFELVGSVTQVVPVRSANRTTSFPILYTFTEEEAVAGKVTFKAVAIVNSAVDAFPADNEALAPPTRVTS